jgi:phosphatidate cytidylyltransferase
MRSTPRSSSTRVATAVSAADRRPRVLRQRTLSAAVLVPPLVVVLLLGQPWIGILVAVLVAGAAWETFRLLRSAGSPVLAILGTGLAVVVAVAIAVGPPAALDTRAGGAAPASPAVAAAGVVLVALAVVLVAAGSFTRSDPRDGLATWVATTFGAVYASLLGFVPALGGVGPAPTDGSTLAPLGPERAWILVLVLGVWSYDTGAYLVGSRLGGPRFLTHISPSKTYAGLVGGLVGSTIVTAILVAALGQPVLVGLVLGPLVGLAAQVGDLAESMLKRAAGAKDSGTLIPGHGGLLDRVDSFLFAAPITTLYVLAVLR